MRLICFQQPFLKFLSSEAPNQTMPESELSEAGPISSRYEFIPDPGKETVEIPVQVKNGAVKFKTGSSEEESESLPDLEDGTTGTLTVLASDLENEEDYERLGGELREIILPSTVLVWFKIKTDHRERNKIPDYGKAYLSSHDLPPTGRGYRLIPVALREHLWLRHRGMKDPEVQNCRCSIPEPLQSKGEEDVPSGHCSLHQAYMGLSEIFEKQRDTHGGNVYTKGYFWDLNASDWRKLDVFRQRTPERCIWMEEDREWLRPLWWKPGPGEPVATVFGHVEEGKWHANSDQLTRSGDDGRWSLGQVVREIKKNGYRPIDLLHGKIRPLEFELDALNWRDWSPSKLKG